MDDAVGLLLREGAGGEPTLLFRRIVYRLAAATIAHRQIGPYHIRQLRLLTPGDTARHLALGHAIINNPRRADDEQIGDYYERIRRWAEPALESHRLPMSVARLLMGRPQSTVFTALQRMYGIWQRAQPLRNLLIRWANSTGPYEVNSSKETLIRSLSGLPSQIRPTVENYLTDANARELQRFRSVVLNVEIEYSGVTNLAEWISSLRLHHLRPPQGNIPLFVYVRLVPLWQTDIADPSRAYVSLHRFLAYRWFAQMLLSIRPTMDRRDSFP